MDNACICSHYNNGCSQTHGRVSALIENRPLKNESNSVVATTDRPSFSTEGAATERSAREATERLVRTDLGTGGGVFKDFLLAEKDKDKNAAGGGDDRFTPEKNKPDGDFSPSGKKNSSFFNE